MCPNWAQMQEVKVCETSVSSSGCYVNSDHTVKEAEDNVVGDAYDV